MIRSGDHREAIFWIVATFARCHTILSADAPIELQQGLYPAFEEIVSDLGINSSEDIPRRATDALKFLPRLWETTEAILLKNSRINP
ncbi:hypothetical protein [Sutcliffiella halmapala]|uniref:hypothetical protein n=1 Tax=Sutcliffiella halmapala TaxID=79882 RepID=UPI000994CD4F|nr:hypothetical protein [Sutcliffiella halmapala]